MSDRRRLGMDGVQKDYGTFGDLMGRQERRARHCRCHTLSDSTRRTRDYNLGGGWVLRIAWRSQGDRCVKTCVWVGDEDSNVEQLAMRSEEAEGFSLLPNTPSVDYLNRPSRIPVVWL